MDCEACGHPNADDARFCGECGQPLTAPASCPECGAATAADQKFCTACGSSLAAAVAWRRHEPSNPDLRAYTPSYLQERIRSEAGALEGERKQVTVLFADITGSMELAAQVDAEDWRRVMDGFFALLCEGVHRFEGTVNKFTGDGIMALFGAPLAHEDHARRACYAAIHLRDELAKYASEIRREHGLNFSVRMGLNSGEVVVGAVGDDLNVDYTAIGHTVGLASRIESLAEPGKAYVTAATAELVAGWFELVPLGEFGLKGVVEQVRVFELAGVGRARSQVEAASERGLTRFVGRDEELAVLKKALAQAQEGSGQVVGIVADPGLGKSRLCWEFLEHCRAEGYEVNEGHGVAHGKRIPLLPVIEMMRGYFGIEDDDSERSTRDKIAGRLLLLDDEFKNLLPVLFDFLGVPDVDRPPPANPEARHRQLLAAVRRLVAAGGRTGRTITLVEDLHWLDPASDVFLENFVDAIAGTHTLVVLNFRPEYQADWMRKSYYRQIPLLPLGAEAIAEMLRDLLGQDPSLDGLAELVHDRTGGNPFYIEEVVQSLAGSGALDGRKGAYRLVKSVEEIAIPPTVQAVLAARIDRLPEREKALLQRASVIGRNFSEEVVRRIAGLGEADLGDALRALVAAEFIFERSLYPEAEYSFKHPLTEEVAYRSQLGDRRAKTHAAVAAAITEVYEDRLDEMAALIANHWEHASEPLHSAQWNARAAAWAGKNHPTEAMRHWRAVRSAVRMLPETNESVGLLFASSLGILQNGGWRLGMPESEVAAVYSDGLGAASYLGDRRLEASLMALYSLARTFGGEVREGLRIAQDASAIARELDDPELILGTNATYHIGMVGDLHAALISVDEMLAIARENPGAGNLTVGFSLHSWAYQFRGISVLAPLGRLSDARADLARARDLAHEFDDSESLQWAVGSMAILGWYTGDGGDSLSTARQAVDIAERQGAAFNRLVAHTVMALAYMCRREWDEAIEAGTRALEIMEETGTGLQYEPWIRAHLATARLEAGEPLEAIALARVGVDLARKRNVAIFELDCLVALARALLLAHGAVARSEVRDLAAQADACIARTGAQFYSAWVEWIRADVAALEGETAAAEAHLGEARERFAAAGADGWVREIEARRERLHA